MPSCIVVLVYLLGRLRRLRDTFIGPFEAPCLSI